MGKSRRQRKKLHLEAKTDPSGPQKPPYPEPETPLAAGAAPELFIKPQEGLFAGLNIDVDSLNKSLCDDVRSVRSLRSVRSEGGGKVLSKKDRIKFRREMLIKKFEVMHVQKLKNKNDNKKKTVVVGDLNPLRDALPSLESLLKSRGNVPYKQEQVRKKRGVEKARTIKKNQKQGIKVFQQILKSKEYQKDPQLAISQHVKAVIEHERN